MFSCQSILEQSWAWDSHQGVSSHPFNACDPPLNPPTFPSPHQEKKRSSNTSCSTVNTAEMWHAQRVSLCNNSSDQCCRNDGSCRQRCIFMLTALPAVYLPSQSGEEAAASVCSFCLFTSALIETLKEAPLLQVIRRRLVEFPSGRRHCDLLTAPHFSPHSCEIVIFVFFVFF